MGGWKFFGTLSVTPSDGAAGDTITINNTGTGFFGTMIVTINGIAATSITVVDHQTVTCVVPMGGSGDVYIENPDGENATIPGAATASASKSKSLRLERQMWAFGF